MEDEAVDDVIKAAVLFKESWLMSVSTEHLTEYFSSQLLNVKYFPNVRSKTTSSKNFMSISI